MHSYLTIVRYPKWFGWAGFLSMALFRFPLWMNKKISFSKLLGSGRNGTFDIRPDWRQWGIITVADWQLSVDSILEPNSKTATNYKLPTTKHKLLYGSFINKYWNFFNCEKWTLILEPIEGHGTWDGKECFGNLPKQTEYEGMIGVLTRATIRLSRLKHFWKHVDAVASQMNSADGFITSVGIGEVPWIKQATFSIWQSKQQMKQFAYSMQNHKEVVRKTKQEKWYSEDMFVRFKVIASTGTLNGINPLENYLPSKAL